MSAWRNDCCTACQLHGEGIRASVKDNRHLTCQDALKLRRKPDRRTSTHPTGVPRLTYRDPLEAQQAPSLLLMSDVCRDVANYLPAGKINRADQKARRSIEWISLRARDFYHCLLRLDWSQRPLEMLHQSLAGIFAEIIQRLSCCIP
jgi:hypothetical protein